MKKQRIVIIGAGPAGLATAYNILRHDPNRFDVTVLEKESQVGGLAKTLQYKGYRFDVGGHRFYTKLPQVQKLYTDLIGDDMLTRKRLSRIYYDGNFFSYPLQGADVIKKIGIHKGIKIGSSYLLRQLNRYSQENNFNEWVSNRFGDALFQMFFKSYTEKVWGIPTEHLSAEWAKQRIQNFSLPTAVLHALTKKNSKNVRTIISEFHYPKLGPGMFYETLKKEVLKYGGNVLLHHQVVGFTHTKKHITSLLIKNGTRTLSINADHVVSTMPLPHLLTLLSFQPSKKSPPLRFRSFLTANLIVSGNPFPDNWIYIHDPEVKVGRIQNFRNWSPYMAKKTDYSPIAFEYFCDENDPFWKMSDKKILKLAGEEAEKITLFAAKDIRDGFVYRVPNAYPIYDVDYDTPLADAKAFLRKISNLHLAGRGGLFRYNNMDHAIQTGYYVAENIMSGVRKKNVWTVTEENDYLEEK